MSVTLTANYREIFSPETLTEIDRLVEDSYHLEDILVFIDEHSEEDFCAYYEAYVSAGEEHGYDAVDYFINEIGALDRLQYFERAYIGEFYSPERMAEDFCDDETAHLYYVVPDWELTADVLLESVVERRGNHYFRTEY